MCVCDWEVEWWRLTGIYGAAAGIAFRREKLVVHELELLLLKLESSLRLLQLVFHLWTLLFIPWNSLSFLETGYHYLK